MEKIKQSIAHALNIGDKAVRMDVVLRTLDYLVDELADIKDDVQDLNAAKYAGDYDIRDVLPENQAKEFETKIAEIHQKMELRKSQK